MTKVELEREVERLHTLLACAKLKYDHMFRIVELAHAHLVLKDMEQSLGGLIEDTEAILNDQP